MTRWGGIRRGGRRPDASLTDVGGRLAPQQQLEALGLLVHAAVVQGGVPVLRLLIQVTAAATKKDISVRAQSSE